MAPLSIGVLGHVDHGKTALVKALTGIETDRLPEEKARGMSIVLGYAFVETPRGTIDLIDVPGHEMFVRTMVRGASGVAGALLTVAADDGVMPQTLEHLSVALLLGIDLGIVAITKSDLVPAARLREVQGQIRGVLRGTTLQGAPFVVTSAATGQGLEELRSALEAMLEAHSGLPRDGPFRLNVDRAFSVLGAGLVATGTLQGGPVRTGDRLEIYPTGQHAIARGLQVHGQTVARVEAGGRVAINLRRLALADLPKGAAIATPGALTAATQFEAAIDVRSGASHAVKSGAQLRLLIGASDVDARIVLVGRSGLRPGEHGFARITTVSPIALARWDRFILWQPAPISIVAGGRVLDVPSPGMRLKHGAALEKLSALERGDLAAAAHALLRAAGRRGIDEKELALLLAKSALIDVAAFGAIRLSDGMLVAGSVVETLVSGAAAEVAKAGQRGIETGRLRTALGNPSPALFRAVLEGLDARGFADMDGRVAPATARSGAVQAGTEDEIEAAFLRAGLATPALSQLVQGKPTRRQAVENLLKLGLLVRLKSHDNAPVIVHARVLRSAAEALRSFAPPPATFTAGAARGALGQSRKYVLPLLEHFDATGVTRRRGDLRMMTGKLFDI